MADNFFNFHGRLRLIVQAGLGLSVLWLVVVALFFLLAGRGEGGALSVLPAIMIVIAVVAPIALVASAVVGLSMVEQAGEIRELRRALAARERSSEPRPAPDAAVKRLSQQLGEVTDRLAELETWLAARAETIERADQLLAGPPVAPAAKSGDDAAQEGAELGLDAPPGTGAAPLAPDMLVRALQFPADAQDQEGFDALRAALSDRRAAQIVIAAQDVLTLLSQDGLYMDDLQAERAPVALWRRFAQGERGAEFAVLGGIDDEEALDRCAARMREDTIFRDAVHHFLRLFDHRLTEIEPEATDPQIAAWTETRSARAFMLLGRAAGIFA